MPQIKIYDAVIKKQENFWNNIHFHPTDAIEDEWGQRILNEVAKDKVADTVRMYAMLEDIVTMDENGKLCYDFTENDVRLDYMVEKGFQILLSYNFIPPCIAQNPGEQSSVAKNKTRYKGKMIVVSPPKDYALWEEVCYEYTKHIVERYGLERVSKWYLQCFNEPDLPGFFMKDVPVDQVEKRAAEYCKLYHGFANGIGRVSKELTIGGPALAHTMPFLEQWIVYVKEHNLQLDYICGHSYGTFVTALNDGTIPFDTMNNISRNIEYLDVLKKHFPDGIDLIMDEWGASAQGFYNVEECPALLFRETEKFAAYYGKMITQCIEMNAAPKKMMICLSGQHEMTVDFSGFRNFFTLNFIRKPIYNAYILGKKIKENVLKWEGDTEHLSVLPTRDEEGRYAVMLAYASKNFDQALPAFEGTLEIENMQGKKHVTVWAIDENHTNPYAVYLKNGYQPEMNEAQLNVLKAEGVMKPVKEYDCMADGSLKIDVALSNNGLLVAEIQ